MKCLQEFPIFILSLLLETLRHLSTLHLRFWHSVWWVWVFLPKAGLAAAYAARDFKLPCTVAALAELFEGCYFWMSFLLAITFGNIFWYGLNRSTCIRLVTVCSLEVGYVHWNVQPTLFEASVSLTTNKAHFFYTKRCRIVSSCFSL